MAKSGQFELAQKEGKRNVNTKTFKKKAVCVELWETNEGSGWTDKARL